MARSSGDSSKNANHVSPDYLIRGEDYLARHKDFKLVGRDEDLAAVANILMRKDSNNILLTGLAGVGVSAVTMGLRASKDDLSTPFDIVSKRFYWLDTDALFSSGDPKKINEGFQKALATLSRASDTVLVIEDMRDFIDGATANGVTNLINALMREVRNNPRFQTVIECRDTDLPKVLACHSDMSEIFIIKEIKEPKAEALKEIVTSSVKVLEQHHGIAVAPEAIDQAIKITNKFYVKELDSAQPKRTMMLIEGALTTFRREVHSKPVGLSALEEKLAEVTAVLEGGKPQGDMAGRTKDELACIKADAEREISEVKSEWETRQKKLREIYSEQRAGEEELARIDEKLDQERAKQEAMAKQADDLANGEAPAGGKPSGITSRLARSGLDNSSIALLKQERAKWQTAVDENRGKYQELTAEINKGLVLKPEQILTEFSRLSGVPVSRLGQDEAGQLLKLEDVLSERVIGQDDPVRAVSKSVRRGRTGLKKPDKPIGSFLFLGPSGVGKTELAKALAAALFGNEAALQRYDMSEYQEKHAVARMIGAPPGYEGYEAGGILTNAMRRHPYCVNIFDEIEKAHKDVFDIFLQIIDDGRLTDNRGLTVSFANAINIMTSNIGAEHFLNEELTFEEAKKRALEDLWNPAKGGYRPEFLNRFTGIYCFSRLELPVIEKIAKRALNDINSWIAEKGIKVTMEEDRLKEMCRDYYKPIGGARSILGCVEEHITSDVADTLLMHPDKKGRVTVNYDAPTRKISTDFRPEPSQEELKVVLAQGQAETQQIQAPSAAAAAKSAFAPGGKRS